MKKTNIAVCTCLLFCLASAAFAQEEIKLQSDGKSISGQPLQGNTGEPQIAPKANLSPGPNIPMWSGFFIFANTRFNFTMVGSDPTIRGAGTDKVPVWMTRR
ncbi:MAG TPA: hypothetical protein VHA33_26800 [Candidatus Angelobacter sp.]|jgi:hypothetical protein|nr:hypothetical protein [Candidatus Angelobacter sp.]